MSHFKKLSEQVSSVLTSNSRHPSLGPQAIRKLTMAIKFYDHNLPKF